MKLLEPELLSNITIILIHEYFDKILFIIYTQSYIYSRKIKSYYFSYFEKSGVLNVTVS